MFKPTIPAITPTPDLIYDASVATKRQVNIPYIILFTAHPPLQRVCTLSTSFHWNVVAKTRTIKLLQDYTRLGGYHLRIKGKTLMFPILQWYAGAPLKKSVGDILHAQGIPLYQLYGRWEHICVNVKFLSWQATLALKQALWLWPCQVSAPPQTTCLVILRWRIISEGLSPAWEYFQFSSHIKPHFVPDGFGAFELIVEVGGLWYLSGFSNPRIGNPRIHTCSCQYEDWRRGRVCNERFTHSAPDTSWLLEDLWTCRWPTYT